MKEYDSSYEAERDYWRLQRKLEESKKKCQDCEDSIIRQFCPYEVGQKVTVRSRFTMSSPYQAIIVGIYLDLKKGIDGRWRLIVDTIDEKGIGLDSFRVHSVKAEE